MRMDSCAVALCFQTSLMRKRFLFSELLDNACSLVPKLWKADGTLNITATSRYCLEMGHEVSQATLQRHYKGTDSERTLKEDTIRALNAVFGIPVPLLRGEAVDPDTETWLSRVSLREIMLAEKILRLPPPLRDPLLRHLDELVAQYEKQQRALPHHQNVVNLKKPSD